MSEQKKNGPALYTVAGAPVPNNQDSITAGARGPVLLEDVWLIEKLAHFDREVIPERRMHAKGSGAFGTFTVTHDISKYTKAKLFNQVGKKPICLCVFLPWQANVARPMPSATSVGLPSSFTPKKATGIWSVITHPCSSSATP